MAEVTARHTHGGGSTVTTAVGVPTLAAMQQYFWAFVGTTIAVATLANVINKIICYNRITSAKAKLPYPAKPKAFFFKAHAAMSAIIREFGYYSKPLSIHGVSYYLPPMGPAIILVAYVVLSVICCLYLLDSTKIAMWETIGYRSGYIAICQIPLIVLLAGKRNIIGFLTGVGYERLTYLHRWVARTLLLTTLIHMGFWFREWIIFDYVSIKLNEDPLTQRGLAAFGILCWLVLSSAAPIRGLAYEVFVVQHILSWLGFLAAVYLHVPNENRIWVWLPLGFWAFDRVARAGYLLYTNMSLFHKNSKGLIACKATFEPLDEGHTRITIANAPVSWVAGQHMFLACNAVAPLASHPFTIASLPEDGKIEFVVCAKKGGTKRFLKYAEKTYPSLPTSTGPPKVARTVLIDGPYSRIRPLRQFDSVVLIAGSTGATFTVPLLREIVQQWTGRGKASSLFAPAGAVTRYVHFVWTVKRTTAVNWFSAHLDRVISDTEYLRSEGHNINVRISIYVTAEDDGMDQSSLDYSEDLKGKATYFATSVVSGRPDVTEIIRTTAEHALGEMSVVVCGPPGLVQKTRNAAVSISDERAASKGTGAQGIYVHAEAFGYA